MMTMMTREVLQLQVVVPQWIIATRAFFSGSGRALQQTEGRHGTTLGYSSRFGAAQLNSTVRIHLLKNTVLLVEQRESLHREGAAVSAATACSTCSRRDAPRISEVIPTVARLSTSVCCSIVRCGGAAQLCCIIRLHVWSAMQSFSVGSCVTLPRASLLRR